MTQNKYTSTILDTICNINAIGKEGVDFFIESVPGGGVLVPLYPSKVALCSHTFSIYVLPSINLRTMFSYSVKFCSPVPLK